MERIDLWTYNCKDGNAIISLDKGTRYIEICEKDLRQMLDWIEFDRSEYARNWRKYNKEGKILTINKK